MSNDTLSPLQGDCLAPFLDMSLFPSTGGFIDGRFCAPIDQSANAPICCLPCPAADWIYSDDLNTYTTVAQWFAVGGLVLIVFMLISYLALPAQKTRSHYLSICLIVSTAMVGMGYMIPLASEPEQCYNEITPNDMYSSLECAWSGSLLIAGGMSAVVWIFIRALSMNLQICWDIVPGRKFFYISQLLGWGIPAAAFTVTMILTGVSFRFGNVCLVNHENSMADFWGPLLGLAAGAGLLQLMTFGYCIRVYLKNLFADQGHSSHTGTGSTAGYSNSLRTQTARAVWRRLQKVLWLQWRGICIVTIILVDVVFFSIVFVRVDSLQHSLRTNFNKVEPWLICLISNPTDNAACRPLVDKYITNEATITAVLILYALTGIQVFIFLTRPSVFPAWVTLLRNKFGLRSEFVSLDARSSDARRVSKQDTVRYSRGHDSTTFEMQRTSHGPNEMAKLTLDNKTLSPTLTELCSPEKVYRSPRQPESDYQSFDNRRSGVPQEYMGSTSPGSGPYDHTSPLISFGSPPLSATRYDSLTPQRQPNDYFGSVRIAPSDPHRATSSHSISSERAYRAHSNSFSAPSAPLRQSSLRSVTFDTRDTISRNGLALDPHREVVDGDEESGPWQRAQFNR